MASNICNNYVKFLFFILLYEVLSITKIESFTLLGSYDTPGSAQTVTVIDDIAYVADWISGLLIINVINPYSPTLMSNFTTPDWAYGLTVNNDIAYVAAFTDGVQIINVTNPYSPTLINYYGTPGNVYSVVIVDDIAYAADGLSGLQIFNVTNPYFPSYISGFNTPDWASGVSVNNDIAYVADRYNGLSIIDVIDPYNPTLMSNYYTSGAAWGVTLINDTAYVADGNGGLQIINVSNPFNPTLVGYYTTPDSDSQIVDVVNGIAYIADFAGGLSIVDVTNPSNPTLIGCYTPGDILGLTVVNDIIYIAARNIGLLIVKVQFYIPADSFTTLDSFTISMIAITSFSIIMILIFIIIKSKLLWFHEANYDIFYLVFPLLGIINVISDILFIIYLSLFRYHFLYLIISSFIFILSIILNYFRTFKWKKLFKVQASSNDIQYLSKNQTGFDNIVSLSIIIHPAILFILKSNWKGKNCFRLPINASSISIPIQCLLYDIYSILPQSIILCFISFEVTPLEWNTFLWIIIIFKLLNIIITISRAFTVLYFGGGKSVILKPLKFGVFKTVKANPTPNLISLTTSTLSNIEKNIDWMGPSRAGTYLSTDVL